ncbi:MAG: SUMF1/EgtB/PvdO family nonheme iron enzyme [Alphaproteobacteria bacterium]|nr:SUMF1/EgtB/PvdO family nonheme iron enzyme [Alphaproteobacteria bacterium]
MPGRDWDREIAIYAKQHGLTEAEAGVLQRFVDAKMRLDSVEVSVDSITYSGRTTQAFTVAETEEADLPEPNATPEKRYLDLGQIGLGGMGEVRRVRDTVLNRFVAMKILRSEYADKPGAVVRFVAEAQATAQLQHPGVVPVHDIGKLPDGRWFFTMKELAGATLEEVILEYLAGRGRYNLRGLVDIVARTCEALAYAHAHGAIHRDIKPANVLIGEFGEVILLDWGLVKATGSPETTAHLVTDLGKLKTKMGAVVGTPAYMPPEQARGAHDEICPASDVYAVGAVLYEVLTGRRPYEGSATEVIQAILAAPPDPLPTSIPPGLAEICRRATERDPEDRYPDASRLHEALRGWLDGAEREERALAIVRKADAMQPEVEFALQASERYAREAAEILDRIPPDAPVAKKAAGWALQDKADAERLRADLIGLERLQLLRSALNEMPGLIDIHERLAYVYHFCHARAERLGDARETAQYAQLLRDHDRGKYAEYLEGTGEVTLRTRPPGAKVTLFGFEADNRRLVPALVGELPTTPFDRHPLGLGSWLLLLEAPGRARVKYPVCIRRNEHFHTVEPGGKAPIPVYLPRADELGPEDCYVPGGWTQLGPRPTQRVWVDPFVIRRFPVTNAEYMEFLDDLLRQGREDAAERFQPRTAGGPCYARDTNGLFRPPSDPDNDAWLPDRPVTCVDQPSAVAYAEWLAARTGYPWRLPWEDEWEKAARGVDGRSYVMGEHLDPAWADVRGSVQEPAYKPVHAFPQDESVYGVRGMTGLVGQWCADAWRANPRVDMDRAVRRAASTRDGAQAVWRGGFRNIPHDQARVFVRQGAQVSRRLMQIGFRLARGLEAEAPDEDISGVWVLDPPSQF